MPPVKKKTAASKRKTATNKQNSRRVRKPPIWQVSNWSEHRHDRIKVLWHVAALSLGAEPTAENISKARKNFQFEQDYEKRKKILGRALSREPAKGHVTFFPDHEYNKNSTKAQNRMVDVVSCIDKLKKIEGLHLPEEFLALRAPLSRLLLPKAPKIRQGLVLTPKIEVTMKAPDVSSNAKSNDRQTKKDQLKATITKATEQIATLFHVVARDAYAYDPNNPASLTDTVKQIGEALKKYNIHSTYGLSNSKIIEFLQQGQARFQ